MRVVSLNLPNRTLISFQKERTAPHQHVYFMVGPMSEGLNGYPTVTEFNLLQPTSTTDRKDTNREHQRQVIKAQRSVRVRVNYYSHLGTT